MPTETNHYQSVELQFFRILYFLLGMNINQQSNKRTLLEYTGTQANIRGYIHIGEEYCHM